MDPTKPFTDFLESSLTMTESLELPEGNNISSLCRTYLGPLDTSTAVPTGSMLEGEAVGECKQTRWKGEKSGKMITSPVTSGAFGLSVAQWGEQECEMWARAVCMSAGIDHNNTHQILRVFSSLNGTQLLQVREHQLSQFLGSHLASIFYLHIQNLKRSKVKDIKKTHKPHIEAQSNESNLLPQHTSQFPSLDQYSQQQQQWKYEHYDHQHYQLSNKDYYRQGQEEGMTALTSYHQLPGASSTVTHPSLFQEDMWSLDEVDSSDLERYLPEEGSSDPLAEDLQELDLETSLLVVKDEPASSRSSSPSYVSQTPHSIPVSPPSQRHTGALDKIPTKTRRKERGPKSWEFLMRLLVEPQDQPSPSEMEDESEATFRLTQPSLVAQLWGAESRQEGFILC
ncbi:hypothetical protein Pcinc_003952 [Petrolisthes cinctipes]|uniref:Uncharacterized protein n=1 Tax=Petrolisthes cinctipes TaxID=88211 RepID=A0AAE1GI25_PETCI|nr:hypothetical protein Pcinc_003952 [Petrolisthes cinctipes]